MLVLPGTWCVQSFVMSPDSVSMSPREKAA
jgi:hypothetical protein